MLVRDVRQGAARLEVFLMRRHAGMEFVAGVTVFPGGGVDDRDRNADVAWYGPEPSWWADRLGVDVELAEALVCAAARETFEESGVLFAGPASSPDGENTIVADASVYRDARKALDAKTLSFGEFLRDEKLVLRADLLRPWANWVTPKEERTRRYDTYFFVGALPEGQRADGDNTETDRAGWATPQSALDDFGEGRSFLLPPTWTQLDSLNGRTVAEVLAVERNIVAVEPHLAVSEGNWEIEFFNSERYNAARNRRAPAGYRRTPWEARARRSGSGRAGERVRRHLHQRGPARYRDAAAVATADEHADAADVPRAHGGRRRAGPAGRRQCRHRVRWPRDLLGAGTTWPNCKHSTPDGVATAEDACHRAIDAVAAIPKPTVAAITGYALGSGLSLALAADWRVSGDNVRFGATEILDGLVPAGSGAARLARAIGDSKAKDLVFSGRFAGAKEALELGLIDETGGARPRVRRGRRLGGAVRGHFACGPGCREGRLRGR